MEIDHEIISMAILLPSADSRRELVSYKRKYNYAQSPACPGKKCGKVNIYHPNMIIAIDWDVKHQTKQKHVLGAHKNRLIDRDASFEYPQHMF